MIKNDVIKKEEKNIDDKRREKRKNDIHIKRKKEKREKEDSPLLKPLLTTTIKPPLQQSHNFHPHILPVSTLRYAKVINVHQPLSTQFCLHKNTT
jgi:hypothetical protein